MLFACLLFVPSILKTDINRNIADNIALFQIQIALLGNRRKLALEFHQFCVDPVVGSCVGVFNGIVQSIAFRFAAGKIRKKSP